MEKTESTQQIVLEILRRSEYVSGEEIAETLKISRTAVWKAVSQLRKDGWAIDAANNRGYRLCAEKSAVSALGITENLERIAKSSGICVDFFPSIDSTNNELKRQAASASSIRDAQGNLTEAGKRLHKRAVVAGEQTGGRGRLGRAFFSGRDNGVYMSLFYSPKSGVTDPARMTANAAVAVCRALSALFGVEAGIKWVNDVFLHGKKICGILAEGVSNLETGLIDGAVVGIGINISSPETLSEEIRSVAGFLEDADEMKGKSADKNKLIDTVLCELASIYDAEEAGNSEEMQKALDEYRSRSILTAQSVLVTPVIGEERTAYQARVIGIEDDLSLLVEKSDGERLSLKSGEVSLHSSFLAH